MLLDAEGRKALYDFDEKAVITELQCSICAPWSYTVTKHINYKQESAFTISEDLLEELISTIHEQIESDLKQNEALQNLGLQVITRATMDICSNGYHVAEPAGNVANTLSVTRASAVSQEYLIDAIDEIRDKLFPQAVPQKISFLLMLFSVARELLPEVYDTCLVDITYEATEMGIVRDGTLKYCTHTPFGSFSLAREIAAAANIPLHEAFGYLHNEKPYAFLAHFNKKQQEDIEQAFESYTEEISKLFKETGDDLSIPKHIAIHTDRNCEPIFTDLFNKAAKRNLKSEPRITPITKEIITRMYAEGPTDAAVTIPSDTALLLSAQFFHTQANEDTFEYL